MRLAVLAESEADERIVSALVAAMVEPACELAVPPIRQRSGGWPAVRQLVPAVVRGVWYRDLADALVVVCDSDDGPISAGDATDPTNERTRSRAEVLRADIDRALAGLAPVQGRVRLFTAVGLAVPAIEAWCLAGQHPDASEARVRIHASRRDLRRDFKRALYGAETAPTEVRRRAIEGAITRLADDPSILDRNFPEGFGRLRRDVAAWGVPLRVRG